jgi:alpha-L-rhamnosidase
VTLSNLLVDSLSEPISIDNPQPTFAWALNGGDRRGVLMTGYEIQVSKLGSQSSAPTLLWHSSRVDSNQSQYILWPSDAPALESDSDYMWKVRAYTSNSTDPTAFSEAHFSTALMKQADWANGGSEWIQTADVSEYAAQMRKEFVIPAGSTILRARAFVALPGYGEVWVNGKRADNEAGTRSLSQYDVRALYHTYDVSALLKPGTNTIGTCVGVGWFGHPAVPPQNKRFPFGPPSLRMLLRMQVLEASGASDASGDSTTEKTIEVGTDASWMQTEGPVLYDDEYNGMTYDARLATPGWASNGFNLSAPTVGGLASNWTAVVLGTTQAMFHLNSSILSAASFPPIDVIRRYRPLSMRMPSPGVYVYDFGQNMPGWCRIDITGEAGLTVQLRHAEVLQHPPYGPFDGNIYNGNLRSAKATDTYILRGDPAGETIEFGMTTHGFRYVELTFPSSPGASPPTLDTLQAVNTRSAMASTGDLTFSDDMLQRVHHNILWGQAANLMMVPTDCTVLLYTVLIQCTLYSYTVHCTHTLYTVLIHCTLYSYTVHCTHTLYTVLIHYTHTLYSYTGTDGLRPTRRALWMDR